MKRTRTHRILLLAALIHLFADVAAVGGAVLCVGPDDHQAIEIGHIAPDCDAPSPVANSSAQPGIASEAGDCTGCTDTALHSDAEIGSKRLVWDSAPPAVLATAFQTQQLFALPAERRTPATRLDLSTTMRVHRITVLII